MNDPIHTLHCLGILWLVLMQAVQIDQIVMEKLK